MRERCCGSTNFRRDSGRNVKAKAVKSMLDVVKGEDNQVCRTDAESIRPTKSTQHMDMKNQFVLHHVRKGDVRGGFVLSEHMVADIMTKS